MRRNGHRKLRAALLAALALGLLPDTLAAQSLPWGFWTAWGDQGDGTYRNPVLPADFSDLDAVRVGRDYYAISSTLHTSPGMAVLHSTDLVNWRIISHVVPDLTVLGPQYRWDRMERFGRGVWAGTIRNHAGKFRVFFGTPDEGFFVSSATTPAGPWSPPYPLLREPGWDDCSVLWDTGGKAWFVATHFADGYKSYIMPMSADGQSLDRDRAILVNEGHGREASKLLKIGDWYYLIFSEQFADKGRYVVARRARHPMGPWSPIRQLAEPGRAANEPNQGALLEAPSGQYFFFTHHGSQGWEGRVASLLPVRWVDGWPMIGASVGDGPGSMVWRAPKPIASTGQPTLQTTDKFSAAKLGPQWEWNHQPAPGSWSLTERPGWLRLRSSRPPDPGNLARTANIPSQRSIRSPANSVTVKLDISGMTEGQHAGLAHISNGFGALGVRQARGRRILEYRGTSGTIDGPAVPRRLLWLRSRWGSDGKAVFAYSLDGSRFRPFGPAYQMTRAFYRGDRVALYTYGNGDQGHVDADYFNYAAARRR